MDRQLQTSLLCMCRGTFIYAFCMHVYTYIYVQLLIQKQENIISVLFFIYVTLYMSLPAR